MNKALILILLLCNTLAASCMITPHIDKGLKLNLADFGAIPDDEQDDSEAFMAALNKCRENPGSELYIPPGNYIYRNKKAMEFEYKAINGQYGEDVQGYFFRPGGEYVIALDMDNFRNITILADGVTLVQEGWYEAVSITNAKNVKIKGLKLTHKRPPFTTGKIVNPSTDYFEMKIDPVKYPYLTNDITGRVHYYDTEKNRIYTGSRVEKKELIDSTIIRIHTKSNPKTGDLCILRHCAHNRAAILIKESSDIVLEDVTIHSQPGMGIVGHRSENIMMRNLQVIPAAGTVTSTNTDATHFTSCKGKILFDACKFGGQGDDCTNIHNYYWCFNKESNDNISISLEDADLHALSLDYPDVGDTLALVARNNLDPVHYYVVRKVRVSQEEWKVTVSLDKPIEYDPDEFYLTNLTRRPSVDIINNTVRSHMARAFLIKTRDVRISGNVIQNSSGTAIQLGAESGWRESGPVENVLIEHNLITGCGYGHGRQKGTAISVEVNGVQETSGKINKNVIIQNNVIEGEGNTAIYVSATQGIRIENNEISGSQKAISIENSESIKVKNNGNLPVMIKN